MPWAAHKWAVKLFLTPYRYPVPEEEAAVAADATQSLVKHHDKHLQVYTWGDGKKTALMVHGWSGRGTQFWKFVAGLVTKGYTVVAFDAPAHHRSTGKRTTLPEFRDAVRTVADQFGSIDLLVGHSLGGVASLHAIADGLSVKKLITVASPSISNSILSDFAKKINGSEKTAEAIKQYAKKITGRDFDSMSGEVVVKQINVEKYLVIHDEDDEDVPLAHADALVKGYPEAKLLVTQKLGHTRILRDQHVVDFSIKFAENIPKQVKTLA